MPPKKAQRAAESQADAAAEATGASGIEAWELPKSLVTKIAKSAVGDSGAPGGDGAGGKGEASMPTKFTKDATLSMVKGSTVFINYVGKLCSSIKVTQTMAEASFSYCSCYVSLQNILWTASLIHFPTRAHDIALSRSHKTISAADVIKALEQLEFGDIATLMPAELEGNFYIF
jgi:DNA polymerase epsilon subunit 3